MSENNENNDLLFPDELDRMAIDEGDDSENAPATDETVDSEEQDAAESTRPTDERMTGSPTTERKEHAGMIEDGVTLHETILLLGLTGLSYAFGWGILSIMVNEGLSSAPLTLWAILGLLVSVPLLALFGTGFSDSIAELMRR